MSFAPTYDLMDGQVSPQERLRSRMMQVIKRKKSITPNPADGFLTVGGKADSDAEGAADATTAPGATGNQN